MDVHGIPRPFGPSHSGILHTVVYRGLVALGNGNGNGNGLRKTPERQSLVGSTAGAGGRGFIETQ